MSKSIPSADNYGPYTGTAVVAFHLEHPEYADESLRQIGPKGWAHLRSMKDGGAKYPPEEPGKATAAPKSSAPTSPSDPTPPPAPPSTPSSGYVLPVKGSVGDSIIINGGCISRTCGGHSGLDISAPQGTPIVAAAAGTVVSMNSSGAAYGIHVVLKHADGVYTLYAHMSASTVSMGQSVAAGQQVGNVGSTGTSSGPHLHFEVRNDPTGFGTGVFQNPLTWLRSHGVSI
jgi:murein DD-endopeptidase MepM/ murein hydrolase activator NlpD